MKRERTTGAKMLDWTLRPHEFCLFLLSRCHRAPIPLNNSCIRVTDAGDRWVKGDSKPSFLGQSLRMRTYENTE